MEKIMKKQSKKSPLWIFRGLLLAALSGLGTVAFAQGVEVCTGTPYTIASTVDASGASTYQWLENGQIVPGASAATYVVPSHKTVGLYTYIRQAKSADCSEWQPSNEFTVTVFNCSFTAGTVTGATATFLDPRDGKRYKTVVMPDGKTWFAQNLNYTKDLAYNAYAYEANGKQFALQNNGVSAIGSYWCPGVNGSIYSGEQSTCDIYGALYSWETAMMVDGKYADETKTSSAWDESWVSSYYYTSGVLGITPNADRNNARGGTNVKGGGSGICPKGWHLPTAREMAILYDKVEGTGTLFTDYSENETWLGTSVGIKLKSSNTYTPPNERAGAWVDAPNRGSNIYNFNAEPAGYVRWDDGNFTSRASIWHVQTSTVVNRGFIRTTWLHYANEGADMCVRPRMWGMSVRCLKE
jgi:uncharacterized protein (TIGR02145 family)